MEARATEVLAALKNSNLSIETKVSALTKLKSDIKQKNVPEAAIPFVFDAVRLGILSPHSSLSTTGFSSLGHLLKRLYLQEQHHAVACQGHNFYPLLLERLGDHKERIRTQASQAFTDFWLAAAADVEQYVLGTALASKNPRAKETSMIWLAKMTREHGLRFRSHVPKLVACLEDADSGVRETAKSTVIELFQNVPSKALSDLKKQLQVHNVRKSIVSSILSSLGASGLDPDMSRSEIVRPTSSFSSRREEPNRPTSVLSMRSYSNGDGSNHSRNDTSFQSQVLPTKAEPLRKEPQSLLHSASNESFSVPTTDTADSDVVEPLYINSQRELDDVVRDMVPHFEGKESEHNWIPREKSVIKLRRITKGNAPHDYQHVFLSHIKTLLDGILKAVNSLRTTLSSAGCNLIQDIARTCGPGIDNMVEILLQQLIKLCGSLKKITAQTGNVTVDVVLGNVSYTSRIMQHLWLACQDKNVQPRLFVTGWIRTIIIRHSSHKSSIEHGGGLELIEKCIKKGLGDANPGVRENMRGTFWIFARVWPERADGVMSALDAKSRALLEKDPGNPNREQSLEISRSGPGPTSSGRPTLRETIRAQKKAGIGGSTNVLPRPGSAQSTFSEMNTARSAAHRPPASTTTRTVPTGASLSSSQTASLSSAPMRPSGRSRRPDIVRPATADPYSRRSAHSGRAQSKPPSPSASPRRNRTKSVVAPGPTTTSPARPKSRIGDAPRSTIRSKSMRSDDSKSTQKEEQSVIGIDREPLHVSAIDFNISTTPTKVAESSEILKPHITSPEHLIMSPRLEPVNSHVLSSPEREVTPLQTTFDSSVSPSRHETNDVLIPNVPMSPSPQPNDGVDNIRTVMDSPNNHQGRNSSDVSVSKIRTPVNRSSLARPLAASHESQSSDVLQVYEDPQSPSETKEANVEAEVSPETPRTPAKTTPLEELPLNEPSSFPNRKHNQLPDSAKLPPPASPTVPVTENNHRRWKKVEGSERKRSLSPRSKDPVKAGDMIEKGLNKIRAGAIDVHGYRKFQSLLRYHEFIVNDESRYARILIALLESLEAPEADKPSSRSLDLKTQVLVTIRLLLALNRQYFATYYARAMTAIITTRKHYESTNHIVSGLEETSEDIVSACNPPEVIDAVLDLLEVEEKTPEGYRMVAMGAYILGGLLRRLNDKNMVLTEPELRRLGDFARQNLRNPQPDVRRAVIDFCLELHDMVKPEDSFWSMIDSPVEDVRPLLTYYIMRKTTRI
ncbi:hypothetical protein VTO42DRAFT_8444 [Malbranchea cinnamomea]